MGAGPGVCLAAPSPHGEVGGGSAGCWQDPPNSWPAGRVLRVPVRTGQPQASRGLHLCAPELPGFSKSDGEDPPRFLTENLQI